MQDFQISYKRVKRNSIFFWYDQIHCIILNLDNKTIVDI